MGEFLFGSRVRLCRIESAADGGRGSELHDFLLGNENGLACLGVPGFMSRLDGRVKSTEASNLHPAGIDQVIGHQVKDSLEEIAAYSERELQFFGNGVGENFLCTAHRVKF